MPTAFALLAAVGVGIAVDAMLPKTEGLRLSAFVGLVAAFLTFYFTKRILEETRP